LFLLAVTLHGENEIAESNMRRNSSFFWASDAQRNLEIDDDDDDNDDAVRTGDELLLPLAPIASQDAANDLTHDGFVIGVQHPAATLSADEESQALILNAGTAGGGGYGSNNLPQCADGKSKEGQQPKRRSFFTDREISQISASRTEALSKSPQSINRKSMQPLVLRFQVV
jgi:hypothetical protein